MIHRTCRPTRVLESSISHYTYYKDYTPFHRVDRFLPNGNVEVVVDLNDGPQFIFDNETLVPIQTCRQAWVSGIRTRSITIPSGRDSQMFVVNFKRGMALPFLQFPLTEIANLVVDAEFALSPLFVELRERLLEAPSVEDKFRVADLVLVRAFESKLEVPPWIERFVRTIEIAPQAQTIDRLAAETGYSWRHVVQTFKTCVGVPPKTFLRILRFQKAIADVERLHRPQWNWVAQESGYYDQSHFISDFKEFSGLTPNEYWERKSTFLNYIPIE